MLSKNEVKKYEKFILGGGSNILITQNINGIVIHNKIKGIIKKKINNDDFLIEIGAGEIWDKVVNWSVKNNLYGIPIEQLTQNTKQEEANVKRAAVNANRLEKEADGLRKKISTIESNLKKERIGRNKSYGE